MKKFFVLVLSLMMVAIVLVGCGKFANEVENDTAGVNEYVWPTTGICQRLPQPSSKDGVIEYDSTDLFEMRVYNVSQEGFAEYVTACREAGFTVDYAQYEDSFDAYDEEGYNIWLSYELGAKTMSIELWAPDEEEESNMESTEATSAATEATNAATEATSAATEATTSIIATETTKEDAQSSNDIRPDFKKAMDSYEDFFESYCEFMKKYQANPTDLGLLTEYAKFMQQYAETMEEMENLKSDDLNAAELVYYTEVNARITKMLLDVAG